MPTIEYASKISSAVDAQEKYLVGLLCQLIKYQSVNPPGDYKQVSQHVRETLQSIGLATQSVEGTPGRTNVVGRLRGKADKRNLCLTSHTDVVGPGKLAQWKHDPFLGQVLGDVIWGRGAADSKGQLVAMIGAAKAIADSGIQLENDLYVSAPVDDETAGQFGLRYLFSKDVIKADAIIFGEATSFGIAHTFKGRMWFTIEVEGAQSHGAFPDKGVNSIEKAGKLVTAIKALKLSGNSMLGNATINIGTISGGTRPNMVPESCVVGFDARWGPPLTAEKVKSKVKQAVQRLEKNDKFFKAGELQISEIRDPFHLSPSMGLIKSVRSAGRAILKKNLPLIGWYSSGDVYQVVKMGKASQGIIFGPGIPWAAHAPNENLRIKDLMTGAKLYALSALSFCGVA